MGANMSTLSLPLGSARDLPSKSIGGIGDNTATTQTTERGFVGRPQTPDPRGRPASRGKYFEVVALTDAKAMQEWIPQWEVLAKAAIEPNVFYEHWTLIPALRLYGSDAVKVAFVLERDPNAAVKSRLVGVFPLEFGCHFRGLSIGCVRMWKHPHCYLASPLIATNFQTQCWEAIFQWLKASPDGGTLFELRTISGDGPLFRSLQAHAFSRRAPLHLSELYTRALLELGGTGEDYIRSSMGGDHRRSYARKKRQLCEKGDMKVSRLGPADSVESWLKDFLQVEASGWKGKTATAMACHDADRQFLRDISHEAFRRNRLMMMTMKLDGRPIASHVGIYAGDGAFAIKIAYDESFGQYSPGILLELEAIHELHQQRPRPCHWVDCCSAADSVVMKRVWKQQRTIVSVICPTGKRGGDLLVSALPMLLYLRGCLRKCLPHRGEKPSVEEA